MGLSYIKRNLLCSRQCHFGLTKLNLIYTLILDSNLRAQIYMDYCVKSKGKKIEKYLPGLILPPLAAPLSLQMPYSLSLILSSRRTPLAPALGIRASASMLSFDPRPTFVLVPGVHPGCASSRRSSPDAAPWTGSPAATSSAPPPAHWRW